MAMVFDGPVAGIVDEDARVEQLLSEMLMEGYILMEKSCPHPQCATPLVKKSQTDTPSHGINKAVDPLLVPSKSFEQPFKPIDGVPFCVACNSHVVTQESEVAILERCESLKSKGGILVAMSASTADSTASPGHEPEIIDVEPREIIDVTLVDEDSIPGPKAADESTMAVFEPVEHVEQPETAEPEEEQEEEEIMAEYSVRREIATKVLGAKMLQGYSLLEEQCGKCGMPMMECKGQKVECVVCPALAKKAKKMLKARKKVAAEQKRLDQEIQAAKQKETQLDSAAAQRKKADEEHIEMMRQAAAEEKQRAAALEAEQSRLYDDARAKVADEANRQREQLALSSMKKQEHEAELHRIRISKAEKIEREYAEATEKRKMEELKIAEETKRIEQMEQRRKMGIATQFEKMSRDVLVAEHRKRLEDKAKLDSEIAQLEEDLVVQRLEARKTADAKRSDDESRMIATLEEEAAAKAQAAEDAIRKAKAALEHVHSARREVIAQTIAMAEEEAVAEAEELIKQDREDYKAPVILPSSSEIKRENWETLRTEGRSVMTRRVMAGWVLIAEFCSGEECHNSPLIVKDGCKECVVCGGSGSGTDGAYTETENYEVVPTEAELEVMRETGVPAMEEKGYEVTPSPRHVARANEPKFETFEEYHEDFETKRLTVSKEISKRMIEGWTLLDTSCPKCAMPLMMDTAGKSDICVLHGQVTQESSVPTSIEERTIDEPFDHLTMDSTLPTIAEVAPKSLPPKEEEKKDGDADDIFDSIRKNTKRQAKLLSPRGDPPESVKAAKAGVVIPETLLDESIEMDIETSSEIVSPRVAQKESGVTADAIANMFMASPIGEDLEGPHGLSAIADLVEVFVSTHISGEVSSKTKADAITDIQQRLDMKTATASTSPKNFNFDAEETGAKKSKPAPENMMRPRSKLTPPRPSSTRSVGRGGPPRTPRSRTTTPRSKGGVVVVGGPGDFDANSLGGVSRAESVATEAIDTILDKIETAKAKLLRDDISVKEQMDAAALIEKLAQAAVAVKALEKLDM